MKQTINKALWLAAISPLAALASPLAYPSPHQWHFTAGADTGIEQYYSALKNNGTILTLEGSNYALGLNQSFGYGRWFYMQARESASIGIPNRIAGTAIFRAVPKFVDLDLRAYFPLSLSKTYKVSLQPQIGFAAHWFHVRSRGVSAATIEDHFTLLRTRSFAPLFGLALGCDVTDNFNFRFGLAVEIHNSRAQLQEDAVSEPDDWVRYKTRRGGINSSLDLNYKVGSNLDLTGSINHICYSPLSYIGTSASQPDFYYINRFSYKAGVRWTF